MSDPVLKTCPKTSQNRFPGLPPLPPTRPEITSRIAFGRPSVELLSILVDFLHIPKLIQNRIPQNITQNLKSWTPDRPNIDFGMTFGIHLGTDFPEILDFVIICVNHQNAFIQSISVGSAHPKSYIFALNFDQISYFC